MPGRAGGPIYNLPGAVRPREMDNAPATAPTGRYNVPAIDLCRPVGPPACWSRQNRGLTAPG